MKLFFIILILAFIIFTLLFIFCACKISSRADEMVEEMYYEK